MSTRTKNEIFLDRLDNFLLTVPAFGYTILSVFGLFIRKELIIACLISSVPVLILPLYYGYYKGALMKSSFELRIIGLLYLFHGLAIYAIIVLDLLLLSSATQLMISIGVPMSTFAIVIPLLLFIGVLIYLTMTKVLTSRVKSLIRQIYYEKMKGYSPNFEILLDLASTLTKRSSIMFIITAFSAYLAVSSYGVPGNIRFGIIFSIVTAVTFFLALKLSLLLNKRTFYLIIYGTQRVPNEYYNKVKNTVNFLFILSIIIYISLLLILGASLLEGIRAMFAILVLFIVLVTCLCLYIRALRECDHATL